MAYWSAALRRSTAGSWLKPGRHYLPRGFLSSYRMVGNIMLSCGMVPFCCMKIDWFQRWKNTTRSISLATIPFCRNWTSKNWESSSISLTQLVPSFSLILLWSIDAADAIYNKEVFIVMSNLRRDTSPSINLSIPSFCFQNLEIFIRIDKTKLFICFSLATFKYWVNESSSRFLIFFLFQVF